MNSTALKIFSFAFITLIAFLSASQAKYLLVELDGGSNDQIKAVDIENPMEEEVPLEEDTEPETATVKAKIRSARPPKKGFRAGIILNPANRFLNYDLRMLYHLISQFLNQIV